MEYSKGEIRSGKVLNELDKFVINFTNVLENHISYVIVSGYVSIVLGRSRATEDVDLLVPKMEKSEFILLFNDLLAKNYECANTSQPDEAYDMLEEHAIRFYNKGKPIPNIEFKQISTDLHRYSFEHKIKLVLSEKVLFISPLEMQIPYKLSLISDNKLEEASSDKDFEDAKHLYDLFGEKINKDEMLHLVKLLKVEKKLEWLEK